MEKASIVIALKNEQAAEKIRLACLQNGYLAGEVCTSGSEAIRRVRAEAPDILLVDFDMPDITGLEAATIVGEEDLCSVVLLCRRRSGSVLGSEDYDVTLCAARQPLGPLRWKWCYEPAPLPQAERSSN